MKRIVYSILAFTSIIIVTTAASAGGFAVREQSAKGQGASYAGVAAGTGGVSSLFWNPAISSEFNEYGFISESNVALIAPYSEAKIPGETGSGDIGVLAFVPASSYIYAWNDEITFGASMNSPLGLKTDAENNGWRGIVRGDKSDVKTMNFSPSVSYKLNDVITIGVGAQVEYMDVKLTTRFYTGQQVARVKGDDLGFGFTGGVLIKPTETTSIGIGFRSSVKHGLKGDAWENGGFGDPILLTDISAKFTSPETVTFGVTQKITDDLTLLGGIEWTNWSRLKELKIIRQPVGTNLAREDYNWKDSWFYSVGAEYAYSDALQLRAGAAFEKSPVPDLTRSVRVPDNDRYWLSLGASYKFSDSMVAHLAYSHVFMKDGDVDQRIQSNLLTSFKQHIDIVSVGLTHDW
jgi:long-chain fatty acid transport protein